MNPGSSPKARPNLFLVGATKSGSTSLYHYLSQHPDVFMCVPKDPHFLSTDIYRINRISEAEYFQLFEPARDEKYIGEASTEYLRSTAACENIKSRFPEAKIVIMLRNPIEKVFSAHAHRVWRGYEDIEDFEEAMRAGLKERRRSAQEIGKNLPSYLENATYTEHVRRYLQTFGRESVFIIVFDDFIADTRKVFDELCEFLGIRTGVEISFKRHNPRKRARASAVSRLMLPTGPPRRLGRRLGTLIPSSVRTSLKGFAGTIMRWNTKQGERPPMPESSRAMLEEVFEDDIRTLSELIGRDLVSLWLSHERPAHPGVDSFLRSGTPGHE